MKVHVLKCWPESFNAIARGRKRGDLRYDDRDYCVDDLLTFRQWTPDRRESDCQDGVWGEHAVVARVVDVERCDGPPVSALVAEPLVVLLSFEVLHMTKGAANACPF